MSQRWTSPIAINAMSVNMPTIAEHPNRHPFSGTLTRLDEPSDGAPHGSYGRRVMLTRAAGERALPSLLGMGINVAVGMNGHAAQQKVGIITSANVVGNEVVVGGFLYAADFPKETASIRAEAHLLGMSFECRDLSVADPSGNPLVIDGCVFTGASILRKSVAAYRTTSLAASADTRMYGISFAPPEKFSDVLNAALAEQHTFEGKLDVLEAALDILSRR